MRVKDNLLVIRMDVAGLTQWGSSWRRERVCRSVEFERSVEKFSDLREGRRVKVPTRQTRVWGTRLPTCGSTIVRAMRGSAPGRLTPICAAAADAPDGQTTLFVLPPRSALNALALLHATLSIGPVLVDSRRCAPFPWGPRPFMKPDISILLKPDILILRLHWSGSRCTHRSIAPRIGRAVESVKAIRHAWVRVAVCTWK